MSIELMAPVQLPHSRYRLVAQIANFDPAAGLHGELLFYNVEQTHRFPIDAITSAQIEIETETLAAMRDQTMEIRLTGEGISPLTDMLLWTTGLPDIESTTASVGDAGKITVTGYGLSSAQDMVLGPRATADADETMMRMLNFTKLDDTRYEAVVPVVLSPVDPPFFTGRVPPSRVFLRYANNAGITDVPVGTTQLGYRISTPDPTSGGAGSTFDVVLFHPAHAPDLAGVTVSFDDIPLAPQSVTELSDLTVSGYIYLTRSRFQVPANASLGVHRVTAKTAFGDEFLSNGPDFTVIVP